MKRIIKLNELDNVAVALEDIETGCELDVNGVKVVLVSDIMFEHKFALADIAKGQKVYKYGIAIGIAYKDIKAGEHVHLQNLKSLMVDGVEDDNSVLEKEWSNRIG